MGKQKDWQALDKHIGQAAKASSIRLTPFLQKIDVSSVPMESCPEDITALSHSDLAKEYGRLKTRCLKQDGTTRLSARHSELIRLKFLHCRWERGKSQILGEK